MQPLSGKKLLIVSIACGLIAAVLAVWYLKAQEAKYRAKYLPQQQAMVKVIVPNENIGKSERVTRDKVTGLNVPEPYVPSGAILVQDWPNLEGKLTVAPLYRGKPITWSAIEGQSAKTFSENVGFGKRAKSVKISRVNSFDGLLRPGDHIDLYGSFEGGEVGLGGASKDVSTKVILPVLEDVVVLAAGREDATGRKYELIYDKNSADGFNMNFTTVTLSVTPRQAAKIELAEQIGDLVAFLRHPKDNSTTKMDYLPVGALFEKDPKETVDMVIGADGKAIGKIVGDNIVDENGNIVGKIVNGKPVSLDGEQLGTIVKNVDQSSADKIAEVADVVRDKNGNIIGYVKDGKVVDKNGNVIGEVKDGKPVALDGSSLGSISKNVALDANGNEVNAGRIAVATDVVRDKNGNIIGYIKDGKVVDKNGKVIGDVRDGKAVALDGSSLGTIEENVALVAGTAVEHADVVRDKNGNVIGRIKDGKIVDKDGNVIGEVKNGKAVALDGTSLGAIEKNVALDANGNVVTGEVAEIADVVRDKDGNVIGRVKDGKVIDKNGNVIGVVKDGVAVALDGTPLGSIEQNVALDASGNVIEDGTGGGPASLYVDFIAGGTAKDGVLNVTKVRLE